MRNPLEDLKSPEKIYQDNPNMMYAVVADASVGGKGGDGLLCTITGADVYYGAVNGRTRIFVFRPKART